MTKEEKKILIKKLEKARKNEKLREVSEHSCALGAYFNEIEEYEEALKFFKESLDASERAQFKTGIILGHRMIAETCISLGYFDEALKHVNLFLNCAQNDNNKVEEQRGLVLKGQVFFTKAEYLLDAEPEKSKIAEELLEKSMDAYRKSYAICVSHLGNISEKERFQMKARLLQNKSLVLIRQNKIDLAQNFLIKAVKICAQEKLKDTECICYLSLGDLYLRREEFENAISVFNKALELSHTAQSKADALLSVAKTFIFMENFDQVKVTLKKAYKIKNNPEIKKILKQVFTISKAKKILISGVHCNFQFKRELYIKLGNAYCSLKVYKRAIENYLSALDCCQEIENNNALLINCYKLLCKAFVKDRQYDKALFYCNQESGLLSKDFPEDLCKTYLKIAKLNDLNGSDFEEVYFTYMKAKTKAEELQNSKLKVQCLKFIIKVGKKHNEKDVVMKSQKEINDLINNDCYSCSDSEINSDSESIESEAKVSGTDSEIKEALEETDVELEEEFDRPKERCKRTKFSIKRNEKGETELHVAAIKGNYKKVKNLIDRGHSVNVRDTAGWTPLHEACNHGYVDIVNILLDYGADINDKGGPCCDGTTPLHDAATNGQMEVVNVLINRGASTLVLNNYGETPLQCLIKWRKNSALDEEEEAIFKKLLKALKSPLDSNDKTQSCFNNKSISTEKTKSMSLNSEKNLLSNDSREKILDNFTANKKPVNKKFINLGRRKRQANSWSEGSSQSEDSDTSVKSDNSSACAMYRNAIKRLRHRPKKFKNLERTKGKSTRALINEKNYVDNCIVEDDDDDDDNEDHVVDGANKRRKNVENKKFDRIQSLGKDHESNVRELRSDFVDLEESCLDQLMKEIEASQISVTKPKELQVMPEHCLKDDSQSPTSDEGRETFGSNVELLPWLKNIPSTLIKEDFSPSKKQDNKEATEPKIKCHTWLRDTTHFSKEQSQEVSKLNLSSSGFESFSECDLRENEKNALFDQGDNQSPVPPCSPVLLLPNDKGSKEYDFKVVILGKEVKISVDGSILPELKIEWLIHNVAAKYPIFGNPDYCISLKTETKASISESDLLMSVANEKIEFTITKWKLLTLNERYEKMCVKKNHVELAPCAKSHLFKPKVFNIFEGSLSTRSFDLSNLKLSSLTLMPICKALQYESFIQNLNLSNNFFGDKGVELIIKLFEKCIIEELNISGCCITSAGIYHFSDFINTINELSKNGLQVLNLSNNPITDDSVEALRNIIEKLPNLSVLNIENCELETVVFDKNYPNLVITQSNPHENNSEVIKN